MKLKRIPPPDLSWPSNNLKNKEVHIVCSALYGLNTYGALSSEFISHEEASAHALRVNKANETGTLYPKAPITIIPLSIFEERNDFGNAALMKKLIEDCFVANEQYWKIPHLHFCFDSGHVFDNELALKTIEETLETRDFLHTQEISIV
jgi:hypothetical protein